MHRKGMAVSMAVALAAMLGGLLSTGRPVTVHAATAPSTWLAGASAEPITPPAYNAADDARDYPLCDTSVFNGPRLFDFEEPYIDEAGTRFFQYPDPYCDANANGRWDGLYDSGGVSTLITWIHDDIWARALAISDGTHTVVIESITSQGLGSSDTQRIRDMLNGYTGTNADKPPVGGVFVSSTHNESSPDPIGIYGAPADPTGTVGLHSGIDDYYIAYLVQQAKKAGQDAVDALKPATLRVGEFTPPDVRARLSTTFLTTDSNRTVSTGPTANGTPEATDSKALVLQLTDSSTGAPIESLFNWAAHNQQTGHAADDSVAPDPSDGNKLKPINRAISDDWPGVFAEAVEAQLGGHAMFVVGDNGSIEDPHEYPLPNPDTECPPTDFNPPRSQGTDEGCITLPRLTGTRLANDVVSMLTGQLASMETVSPQPITWGTSQFTVPLQNQLFIAAFAGGLFAHRTPASASPCLDSNNVARTCFQTETGLIDFGPQLQMLLAPGEAYPALVEGHPFGVEQISCPERPEPATASWHASATHKIEMGLADDMLGYLIPAPGWFADPAVYADPNCPQGAQFNSDPSADYDQYNNYHKLESESVGPDTGNSVGVHLSSLADCAAAGTLQACSTAASTCVTGNRTIEPGRFLLADGTFTRKGRDSPVGMWLLPCGTTSFASATGTLIALDGISAFGSQAVQLHGVFMDFDGRPQPSPDINTRGMLVTQGSGTSTYYFLDAYAALSGNPPGPPVVGPQVPEAPLVPFFALAAFGVLVVSAPRMRLRKLR
ncbi:MAG: hypothetical protein ABR498_08320 [Candidatus Dormibacteria bacterium]